MKPKIIYPAFLLTTIALLAPKVAEAIIIPKNLLAVECQSLAQVLRDRPDFFEDGRQQFEGEIQRLEKPTPQSVLTVNSENFQWQNWIFREGGFSIWVPRGTITEETEVLEAPRRDIDFQIFASHLPTSWFAIAYSENLAPTQLENPEEILAKVRDRIIEKMGLELASDRPLNLRNYPGRELILQNSEERIAFRIYLAKKRLYVLGGSQPLSGELSQAIAAFFDSFQLE